jgi:hypothetical protein
VAPTITIKGNSPPFGGELPLNIFVQELIAISSANVIKKAAGSSKATDSQMYSTKPEAYETAFGFLERIFLPEQAKKHAQQKNTVPYY